MSCWQVDLASCGSGRKLPMSLRGIRSLTLGEGGRAVHVEGTTLDAEDFIESYLGRGVRSEDIVFGTLVCERSRTSSRIC